MTLSQEERWTTIFEQALAVFEMTPDTFLSPTAEPEPKKALLDLDNETEAFIAAVRCDNIETNAREKVFQAFYAVANHTNATPLVKDCISNLLRDRNLKANMDNSNTSAQIVKANLTKPEEELDFEHKAAARLEKTSEIKNPRSKNRLNGLLTNLVYIHRDAWDDKMAETPKAERQKMLQRLLNDIRYVEKEAFGIKLTEGDELYVSYDSVADKEALESLCQRIIHMWAKDANGFSLQ